MPASRARAHEVVVELVVEEQLRDQEPRARVDLLAGVAQVASARLGGEVDLGEARGADGEVVVGADQLDQLAGVAQAAVGRGPLAGVHAGGRVAAQREHVLDPGVAHAVERRRAARRRVAPTQVKCAIASRPWSALMRETMSIVLPRWAGVPPAP